MELYSPRLLLRDFEYADIPILYRYNLHPEVRRFEESQLVTEFQFHRIIEDIIAEQAESPRKSYYFALRRRLQSDLIGSCYVAIRDDIHRQAEIGYLIGFEHWGQGYATEAARAVIAFGFQRLQIHRIYAEALCENRASLRVLEKLGMRREALLREQKWFQNRWWDVCIYALLEDEWRETLSP